MKRYKITIEEEQYEEALTSQQWLKGGSGQVSEDGEYGYTPQIKTQKKVNRTVFSQNLDDLNLTAVIKAVNGIE